MHRFRSGFYWDRIFIFIIAPIIVIVMIIASIIYVPAKAIEHRKQVMAQELEINREIIKNDILIQKENRRNSIKKLQEYKNAESARKDLENVQKSTLEYETKLANKKYCKGTCVEDEEYGFGRVEKVYGFEITTKEGWNFNYIDVENKVRKLTVISPRRYKKMLKNN